MPPVPARDAWWREVTGAASRLLNAALGGDGAVTFSAQSAALAEQGRATWRARAIDAVLGAGHCAEAAAFHRAHRLME